MYDQAKPGFQNNHHQAFYLFDIILSHMSDIVLCTTVGFFCQIKNVCTLSHFCVKWESQRIWKMLKNALTKLGLRTDGA